MDRRSLVWVAVMAVLATSTSAFLYGQVAQMPTEAKGSDPQRIVSLTPPITETLFAIGAGHLLVGRSDFCLFPKEAERLAPLGSGIQPNLEALTKIQPDLILTEPTAGNLANHLHQIAPTHHLPWVTLDDVKASISELGRLTRREDAAQSLAARFSQTLSTPNNPNAPTLLLILGMLGTGTDTVWAIRRDSLHGHAIRAAGARNALQEAGKGSVSIGLERLLELDPDIMIVLSSEKEISPEAREAYLAFCQQFKMLKAVQQKRIGVLAGPEHFSTGPHIFGFIDALKAEIQSTSKESSSVP